MIGTSYKNDKIIKMNINLSIIIIKIRILYYNI